MGGNSQIWDALCPLNLKYRPIHPPCSLVFAYAEDASFRKLAQSLLDTNDLGTTSKCSRGASCTWPAGLRIHAE